MPAFEDADVNRGISGSVSVSLTTPATIDNHALVIWAGTGDTQYTSFSVTVDDGGGAVAADFEASTGDVDDTAMTVELWTFTGLDPSTTYTIEVTGAGASAEIFLAAELFSDVDQTDPFRPGSIEVIEGSQDPQSVDVTSQSGDLVADCYHHTFSGSPTVGSGQTERFTWSTSDGFAGSTEPGASTVTMSWSRGSGENCLIAGSLQPPASGGTTLTVQDLSVATSLEQPALTQANVLSVDPVDVATSIEAPALTQANVLAVSELTVATSLESPSLTQGHVLSVADLLASTSLETLALIQDHVLQVADLLAATTLEEPTLSGATTLSVDPISVATTLETPQLIQAHVLAVQDLLAGTSLEGVTLSLSTLLTVADLLVATSLEAPALTQGHVLSVAPLDVATALEAPALTQGHVLTVADLLAATSLDNVVLPGGLFADPRNVLAPLVRPRILGSLDRGRITGHLNRSRILGSD